MTLVLTGSVGGAAPKNYTLLLNSFGLLGAGGKHNAWKSAILADFQFLAEHFGLRLTPKSAQCWSKIAWLPLPGPHAVHPFHSSLQHGLLNYLETYVCSFYSYVHIHSLFILVTLPKADFVRWSNFHHIREISLADVSCTQEAQTSTSRLVWQMQAEILLYFSCVQERETASYSQNDATRQSIKINTACSRIKTLKG